MIEFGHVISEFEARRLCLDLGKGIATALSAKFPGSGVKLAIVDGRGRVTFAEKYASDRIFNLGQWFRTNNITPGDTVRLTYDPGELIYDCPVLHASAQPIAVTSRGLAGRTAITSTNPMVASTRSAPSDTAVEQAYPTADQYKIIEFGHKISDAEARNKYIILRDETGRPFGAMFKSPERSVAIKDGQGRVVVASRAGKSAPNQVTGGIAAWFIENEITPGTKILVRYDPAERTEGRQTLHLIPQSRSNVVSETGGSHRGRLARALAATKASAVLHSQPDGEWATTAVRSALEALGGEGDSSGLLRWITENTAGLKPDWQKEVLSSLYSNSDGRGAALFESVPDRFDVWRLASRAADHPTGTSSIELRHMVSGSEISAGFLDLRDDLARVPDAGFPGHDTVFAIVDGLNRVTSGRKYSSNQIWQLGEWFLCNPITAGAEVLVSYNRGERNDGRPTLRIARLVSANSTTPERAEQATMESGALMARRSPVGARPDRWNGWAAAVAKRALEALGGQGNSGDILHWVREHFVALQPDWQKEVLSALYRNADRRGACLFRSISNRFEVWRLVNGMEDGPNSTPPPNLSAASEAVATSTNNEQSDSGWVAVITAALEALGGEGSTPEILRRIEAMRPKLTPGWKWKVIRTIEDHAPGESHALFQPTSDALGWRLMHRPAPAPDLRLPVRTENGPTVLRTDGLNDARMIGRLIMNAAKDQPGPGLSATERYLLAIAALELERYDYATKLVDLAMAGGLPAQYRGTAERLRNSCAAKVSP